MIGRLTRALLRLLATRTVHAPELAEPDPFERFRIDDNPRGRTQDGLTVEQLERIRDGLAADTAQTPASPVTRPYDGFDAEIAAYRKAAAVHGLHAEPLGVWPPVPTPPPAPRPRAPRLANGTEGYGLRRAATVDEDLACVDRLDLSPQRKQWLKAEIRAGRNLWDLLAQDDWDDLPTPGATPTEKS